MAVSARTAAAGVTVRGVCAETHRMERFLHTPADLAVSALAARQDGVVSTAQFLAAGLGEGAIRKRVLRGRLIRLHRGVYAVGHAQLTPTGWAAHATPTIRVHRSRTLRPADITDHDGLPVTTVARTLVDLATTLTPHRLERVVHRAEHLRLLDIRSLDEQLKRAHSRRTRPLQAAIERLSVREPDITRSELEERFLSLILNAGFPRPETNACVGAYEVDFLWPDHHLVVETDGAATHATLTAFEEDRRRDATLATLGFRVLRFTWRQVLYEPHSVLRALRRALAG